MTRAWPPVGACAFFICAALLGSMVRLSALEEGEVTGRIKRLNVEFLRNYEKLDYGGQGSWA